ncbi:unnamed protein product [Linum perenne]
MAARAFGFATVVLSMAVLLQLVIHAHGAVHKVGDSAGWTTIGSPDYKKWSATKSFQVGDIVRKSQFPSISHSTFDPDFEYNPQFHNVMRVTHAMYRACNASSPLATYTTGNDSVAITTRGHHYFICGVNGHCQSGQKVDINVFRSSSTAPAPSSMAAPTLPSSQSPGPSANSASSCFTFMAITQAMAISLALAILS